MFISAMLLFDFAFTFNLAPVEFRELVGLYIATLFIVWQIIKYLAFEILPTLQVLAGGVFIITGGLIITFVKTKIKIKLKYTRYTTA